MKPHFFASSVSSRCGHGKYNVLLYKVKLYLWIFERRLIIRYRENGVVAPHILYLGNRWTPKVTLLALPFSLKKRSPIPTGQDTGWVQGSVCGQGTGWVQGPVCGQDTGWSKGRSVDRTQGGSKARSVDGWVQGPFCEQDTVLVQGPVCVLNRRKNSSRS